MNKIKRLLVSLFEMLFRIIYEKKIFMFLILIPILFPISYALTNTSLRANYNISYYSPVYDNAYSITNYSGTVQGTPTFLNLTSRPVNNAYWFRNAGDYLNLAYPSVMQNADNLTVEMWANLTHHATKYPYLFTLWQSSNNYRFTVYFYTDNTINMRAIGVSTDSGTAIPISSCLGSWCHYVFSWSTKGEKVWINGNLNNTDASLTKVPNSVLGSADGMRICGWSGDAGGDCSGSNVQIGLIRIWNRTLTNSEVTELYNNNNAKYYPFDISNTVICQPQTPQILNYSYLDINSVNLTFDNNIHGDYILINRSTINIANVTTLTYMDNSLTNNTQYTYTYQYYNSSCSIPYSNISTTLTITTLQNGLNNISISQLNANIVNGEYNEYYINGNNINILNITLYINTTQGQSLLFNLSDFINKTNIFVLPFYKYGNSGIWNISGMVNNLSIIPLYTTVNYLSPIYNSLWIPCITYVGKVNPICTSDYDSINQTMSNMYLWNINMMQMDIASSEDEAGNIYHHTLHYPTSYTSYMNLSKDALANITKWGYMYRQNKENGVSLICNVHDQLHYDFCSDNPTSCTGSYGTILYTSSTARSYIRTILNEFIQNGCDFIHFDDENANSEDSQSNKEGWIDFIYSYVYNTSLQKGIYINTKYPYNIQWDYAVHLADYNNVNNVLGYRIMRDNFLSTYNYPNPNSLPNLATVKKYNLWSLGLGAFYGYTQFATDYNIIYGNNPNLIWIWGYSIGNESYFNNTMTSTLKYDTKLSVGINRYTGITWAKYSNSTNNFINANITLHNGIYSYPMIYNPNTTRYEYSYNGTDSIIWIDSYNTGHQYHYQFMNTSFWYEIPITNNSNSNITNTSGGGLTLEEHNALMNLTANTNIITETVSNIYGVLYMIPIVIMIILFTAIIIFMCMKSETFYIMLWYPLFEVLMFLSLSTVDFLQWSKIITGLCTFGLIITLLADHFIRSGKEKEKIQKERNKRDMYSHENNYY